MATNNCPGCIFEVNFSGTDWTILPADCQEKIKSALTNDTSMIDIEYSDTKATVNLTKMTLTEGDSSFKKIRCVVGEDVSDYYSWSFKDDSNRWRSYHPRHCLVLEQAFKEGEYFKKFEIAGKNYTVHFGHWHQESELTGFHRKVSRIMSKALKPKVVKEQPKDGVAKQEPTTSKSAASGGTISKSMMHTVKGRPPVDPEAITSIGTNLRCHIYVNTSGDIYDALLNQTNVSQNNNKYYIIQLLEADSGKQYWTWTRWGRVGYKGQNHLAACGADLDEARRLFEEKFHQKTKNVWEDRKSFVKFAGKYDLIERDFGAENDEDENDATGREQLPKEKSGAKRKGSASSEKALKKTKYEQDDKQVESKLDIRLQELLEMICDIHEMEEVVVSMNYDVAKAPLGKLTTAQLKAGYTALQKIADIVEAAGSEKVRKVSSTRKSSASLSSSARAALIDACNEFYTRVPHCFGMRQPPLISTHGEVKSKLELLETLGDIEIAIHSMKQETPSASPEHPIDRHYRNLKCSMTPVEVNSNEYKLIDRYLHETHGQTHNSYKTELLEVFATERVDEVASFRSDIGNNVLLWHGSRLTNYYGILSQGLRIAPPEAPSTGYMFGKGVYFADSASKSANYCQTSALRDVGFVMLCKVALGKPNELIAADYKADKLPKGYNSVKGLGRFIPDSKAFVTLEDGTVVPVGRLMPSTDVNSSRYSLLYNEYVVYDTRQIVMKYVCKVKFHYKF